MSATEALNVTPDPGVQPAPASAPEQKSSAQATWHKFEGETLGYLQNKGWKLDDPAEFSAKLVKSYRDLESMRGIPADQLVRWPKDLSDEEGWKAVYKRLGVPEKPEDYKIDGLKYSDGSDVEPEYVEHVRNIAARHKLTTEQAKAIAAENLKFFEQIADSDDAEMRDRIAAEDAELLKSWGPNYQANLHIAREAAQALAAKLGRPKMAEAVSALEGVVGKAAVLDLFRYLGMSMSEDRFVSSGNGGTAPMMSREQAQARLNEIKQDQEWQAKFRAGSQEHMREFRNLTSIIAGHPWPAHMVR